MPTSATVNRFACESIRSENDSRALMTPEIDIPVLGKSIEQKNVTSLTKLLDGIASSHVVARAGQQSSGVSRIAEAMLVRALRTKQNAWGAEHPTTRDTINVLADIYLWPSRLSEAEDLLLYVLNGSQVGLGDTHPKTVRAKSILNNLLN